MMDDLTAVCPECQHSFLLPYEPRVDLLLLCPNCETILMITAVQPMQIDWAFEEPLNPEDDKITTTILIPRAFPKSLDDN